jgi:hypothetical protein
VTNAERLASMRAPLDFGEGDTPGYTACDLHGVRAVIFGDGSMALSFGASALHLVPKQVAALEAFLAIRPRGPG